jgi:predicted regulator of Ras-like GTPase activity (Roadblock/LC7/MglB family)
MMSKLDDLLKEMSGEVTGYITSALVGLDGIPVATHANPQMEVPGSLSAQMTTLLKMVQDSVDKLGAGEVEDDLVTTEYTYILMRYLPGRQYYLVLVTYRKIGNLGNMRLVSRNFSEKLSRVITV